MNCAIHFVFVNFTEWSHYKWWQKFRLISAIRSQSTAVIGPRIIFSWQRTYASPCTANSPIPTSTDWKFRENLWSIGYFLIHFLPFLKTNVFPFRIIVAAKLEEPVNGLNHFLPNDVSDHNPFGRDGGFIIDDREYQTTSNKTIELAVFTDPSFFEYVASRFSTDTTLHLTDVVFSLINGVSRLLQCSINYCNLKLILCRLDGKLVLICSLGSEHKTVTCEAGHNYNSVRIWRRGRWHIEIPEKLL
jgi:hypothetical protein